MLVKSCTYNKNQKVEIHKDGVVAFGVFCGYSSDGNALVQVFGEDESNPQLIEPMYLIASVEDVIEVVSPNAEILKDVIKMLQNTETQSQGLQLINKLGLNYEIDVMFSFLQNGCTLLELFNKKSIKVVRSDISTNKGLFDLVNLEELDLSDSAIECLPSEIGKLKNLKVLNLHNNKITELPVELLTLNNLETIIIANNPLKDCKIITALKAVCKVIEK